MQSAVCYIGRCALWLTMHQVGILCQPVKAEGGGAGRLGAAGTIWIQPD